VIIMRNLLYKDLQIIKTTLIILFIIIGMFTMLSGRSFIEPLAIPLFFCVIHLHSEYRRNNGELLLNSLPISRSKIVIARYLFVFLYSSSLLLFLIIIGFLFHYTSFISGDYLNLQKMIYHLLAIYLAIFAYLPLYFRFGAGKANTFLAVLYLFPLILDLVGLNIDITNYLNPFVFYLRIPWLSMSDPLWLLGIKSLLTWITALAISVSLSIWFYQKKEF
jgi:ABC-2 type transport system permease protein